MVTRPLRLTREQIARIVGNDQDAIRQFERLFAVGENSEAATPALQAQVDALSLAPAAVPSDRQEVETLDWRTFPQYVPQQGRQGWEPLYGTLGLGLAGNAMARLGINSFVRVANGTAGTLARGTVVGATAVNGAGWPVAVPFLADGATPAAAALGFVAESIAPGRLGYACTLGPVMWLDTSAFAAGAVVYANGAVAGAVAASPGAVAVPLGVVTSVSSTQGVIVARVHQMGGPGLAAVAPPAGGGTVDAEARAAIGAIIARLQQAGITL